MRDTSCGGSLAAVGESGAPSVRFLIFLIFWCSTLILEMSRFTLSDMRFKFSRSSLFSAFRYFFFFSFCTKSDASEPTYVVELAHDYGRLLQLVEFVLGLGEGSLNSTEGIAALGVVVLFALLPHTVEEAVLLLVEALDHRWRIVSVVLGRKRFHLGALCIVILKGVGARSAWLFKGL